LSLAPAKTKEQGKDREEVSNHRQEKGSRWVETVDQTQGKTTAQLGDRCSRHTKNGDYLCYRHENQCSRLCPIMVVCLWALYN